MRRLTVDSLNITTFEQLMPVGAAPEPDEVVEVEDLTGATRTGRCCGWCSDLSRSQGSQGIVVTVLLDHKDPLA